MKKIYPNLDLINISNSFLSYLHCKKISLLIAFVTFFGLTCNLANAQGVSCASATTVNVDILYTGGVVSDTTVNDPTAANCNGQTPLKDAWIKFVATTTTAKAVFRSTNRNLMLYGYSGACAGLTQIGCANATTAANSAQTEIMYLAGLTIGNTYHIRIANSTADNLNLSNFIIITKDNDNCANAIAVPVNSNETCTTAVTSSSIGASQTIAAINCGGSTGNADDDVWFSFVATSTSHDITGYPYTAAQGGINDMVIDLRSGACNGTNIFCADATAGANPEIISATGLTIGTTYYFRVYSYGNAANAGAFDVCITTPLMKVPTSGNNTYTTCSGILYDNGGIGNYANNSNGYSVITPNIPGNYAQVTGSGNAESSYDYLYIYDGIGTGGSLLWSGTGTLTIPLITSITGSLTVRFTSDGSTVASGFALTISCTTTAGVPVYCEPSTDTASVSYINDVRFVGTFNDVSKLNSSYGSANGYQNWTSEPKAIQAQGEGINIIADGGGARGGWKAWVDWNKDGDFNDPGEEIYAPVGSIGNNAVFGFVIPISQTPGDYRMRIRIGINYFDSNNNGTFNLPNEEYYYDFNSCENFINTTYFGLADYYFGEAEDYLFTVVAKCNSLITSITDNQRCGNGTINLMASATAGVTEFRWYSALTGGVLVGTSAPSGTTTTWTTPSISATTNYYVTAWNGSCETQVRTLVVAKINPTPVVAFTPAAPIVCGDNGILQLTAGGDKEIVYLIDENFEAGSTLGVFTNVNNDANSATIDNNTSWRNQNSTLIPNTNVWLPAISSGFGANKFALAYSDSKSPNYTTSTVENSITLTNSVSTNTFLNLTLKLKLFYSRYFPDGYIDASRDEYVNIELSTDNGVTYPNIIQSFSSDIGIGTKFAELSYDISSYANQPNLKIRIRHRSWASGTSSIPDGVAVDEIQLFGERPLNTAFNYDTSVVDAFTNVACTPIYAYVSGSPATTIWIKPTTLQLENPSFSIPVTATLSNGCSATGSVVITNNTRTWQGLTTDWNSTTNWKPDVVPTIDNCVIIPSSTVITGPNYNAYGKNLLVKSTGNLSVLSSNNITIADGIIVEPSGVFQIENNSNLVQINDNANTGNIIYKRIAPGIRGSDYVYWSSPVANQALGAIYTTPSQGNKYYWDTLIDNGNGTGGNISHGNFISANGATMGTGIGYIVRGSSSFGMPASNITSTFTGRPYNGTIPVIINRGSYTNTTPYIGANGVSINNIDDNYNLIGNPYPSAINALRFIFDNNAVILGNVKLWTHGTSPGLNNGGSITNPFYGTFAYNYSAGDYMTINYMGATIPTASSSIRAGQAFFVEMKDGPQGSGTVNFNNVQRRDGTGIPYANDGFFKNSNQQTTNLDELDNLERHRIWLDILDANNLAERTLVGYAEGATMGDDNTYDAAASTLTMGIYSMLNNQPYVIQGRSLPFDDNDEVAIGYNVPSAGTYRIGINTADGLFLGTQDIYLKDELLNIYHDLKSAPYSFTTTAGIHNTRFKLVYKNTVLSNTTFNENEIQIVKNKNIVEIVSGNEIMDNVKIYDVRGRLIVEKTKINNNIISIDINGIQDQVLIVNIVTSEGIKVTRKIL